MVLWPFLTIKACVFERGTVELSRNPGRLGMTAALDTGAASGP